MKFLKFLCANVGIWTDKTRMPGGGITKCMQHVISYQFNKIKWNMAQLLFLRMQFIWCGLIVKLLHNDVKNLPFSVTSKQFQQFKCKFDTTIDFQTCLFYYKTMLKWCHKSQNRFTDFLVNSMEIVCINKMLLAKKT